MYDIIVFENLRFRPSKRKREASVFKNLHSGERFWKDAFWVTVFTRYVLMVGQTGEQNIRFRLRIGVDGQKPIFFFFFFLCSRCHCHASIFILKETDTTPYGFLTKSNYQPTLYLLVALVHTLLLQGSRLLVFPESELYTSNPWGNQTEHSSLRNSKWQYSFLASVVHTGLFYDTSILHENNC